MGVGGWGLVGGGYVLNMTLNCLPNHRWHTTDAQVQAWDPPHTSDVCSVCPSPFMGRGVQGLRAVALGEATAVRGFQQ